MTAGLKRFHESGQPHFLFSAQVSAIVRREPGAPGTRLKSVSSFYLCARFSRIGIQELRFFDISNLVVQEKL
jgi:hypothetical protein